MSEATISGEPDDMLAHQRAGATGVALEDRVWRTRAVEDRAPRPGTRSSTTYQTRSELKSVIASEVGYTGA